MTTEHHDYERIPYLIKFKDNSPFKETYGGEIGVTTLKAHLLRPTAKDSKTVVVFMHPVGGGEYLPMVNSLTKAGNHVIYCQSRYPGNDCTLIMEKVVIDLGACIRDAKERLGYEKVILAGWSGGGSLSLFYQSQAENPTITHTPAGDPVDLTAQKLIPADGIMLLAAHVCRAHTFTEWIDPAVLNENDPTVRDPELDIYNPKNPNQPPYSEEFLKKYRAAQIERNRRITRWAKSKLQQLRDADRPADEYSFVVHATMADPKWLDSTIDPNDRKPNWCFLGDPQVVNNNPIGLARFCSLRSWLSQWSYDDTNADGVKCAGEITIPALVIGNSADDGITPMHTHRLYDAIAHDNKQLTFIQGANHYYFGQPHKMQEAIAVCNKWLEEQSLV